MVLNFAGTDSFGIKQQDLLLYAGDTFLVLLDDQRFEFSVPIAGNLKSDIAIFTANRLFAMTIAPVLSMLVAVIVFFVTQVLIPSLLSNISCGVPEKMSLEHSGHIFSRLEIVLLNERPAGHPWYCNAHHLS